MGEFRNDVAEQLRVLSRLSREKLLGLWISEFGGVPHFRGHGQLIALILAYRLQAKAYGGLRRATRKRLLNLAKAISRPSDGLRRTTARANPGTRLIREWRGETHVVSVLADGIEHRGKRYGSLSEVARVITGTRWSGPAFFGLKSRTTTSRAKAAE